MAGILFVISPTLALFLLFVKYKSFSICTSIRPQRPVAGYQVVAANAILHDFIHWCIILAGDVF